MGKGELVVWGVFMVENKRKQVGIPAWKMKYFPFDFYLPFQKIPSFLFKERLLLFSNQSEKN